MDSGMEIIPLCGDFEVAMKHVTLNPFGQVSNGQISFCGYTVPGKSLRWLWNPRGYNERGQGLNRVNCLTFPSCTQLTCNFDDIKDYEDRKRRLMGLPFFFIAPGIDLLPLTSWKHPKFPERSFFEGILVVRDARGDCFRRCGYFSANDLTFRCGKAQSLLLYMQENDNIVLI